MDAREKAFNIHRTVLFDRCLEELQMKGGMAEAAAKKAVDFINAVTDREEHTVREKFSFTRHGEARIRNCRKIDLGSGYRLVCLLKDGHCILLYAGSHDDCSRWLMRNRRMNYELKDVASSGTIARPCKSPEGTEPLVTDDANKFAEDYEAKLMSRIDDGILRKVFSGLVKSAGFKTE
jgi:hypothetical protein